MSLDIEDILAVVIAAVCWLVTEQVCASSIERGWFVFSALSGAMYGLATVWMAWVINYVSSD
jgi:hypothetical protein